MGSTHMCLQPHHAPTLPKNWRSITAPHLQITPSPGANLSLPNQRTAALVPAARVLYPAPAAALVVQAAPSPTRMAELLQQQELTDLTFWANSRSINLSIVMTPRFPWTSQSRIRRSWQAVTAARLWTWAWRRARGLGHAQQCWSTRRFRRRFKRNPWTFPLSRCPCIHQRCRRCCHRGLRFPGTCHFRRPRRCSPKDWQPPRPK